jgi:hypothetical protein
MGGAISGEKVEVFFGKGSTFLHDFPCRISYFVKITFQTENQNQKIF